FLGETLDDRDGLAGVLFAGRANEDRAVVLDVDGALGLLDDRADHLATGADNDADFLTRDLDAVHAGGVARELATWLRDRLDELLEDDFAGAAGATDNLLDHRQGEPVDLEVGLDGGDALRGAGDFEVHVAEGVLGAGDVGEDLVVWTVLAGNQAHRHAGD